MNDGRLPDLIPLEVLLGNPEKASPTISPDGARMAYLAPVNDVLNVWVGAVGSDDYQPVTKDTDRGIRGYGWAYDNRHVLYIQDQGGDENWHLYAVDLDGGEIRDLTPFEGVQAGLVASNKSFPDELLIQLNRDDVRLHDAYHLDIGTGELRKVAANPGNVTAWVADRRLRVRAAQAQRPDGGFDLLVRDDEEAAWRTLVSWSAEEGLGNGPVGFTLDGSHLYARDSRDANATRLVRIDLASGDVEVVAEDPSYDVTAVQMDPDTYEPQAAAFLRARLEWQVLDPKVAADFELLGSLRRGDFQVVNRDVRDRTWLVACTSDDGPTSFFAYDRGSREATFLFDHRPELNKYTLARMEPVTLRARDGLELHGYLTLPPGPGRAMLPLVLDVHGGPWSRDVWGFNPEAQWLANRGYAVLQVNFRGSTGYGKAFLNAGDREWGAKMHDDLIDAVSWAIEKGVADPARVAIMGGSYGGYAALVGATFTPEVFRCAVDIVGPSNIKTLLDSIPPYWSAIKATFLRRVGDPETEETFLWSRSPLSKVDEIRIPMLIAQGANDPRVKQAESDQIVQAMADKGIDHEYVLFPDEGHGFAKPENRLRFYAIAERFLAKHLGGRAG